ncbi:MAG: hypothetical protein AAF296_13495 [Pseudomonadota bacterium]
MIETMVAWASQTSTAWWVLGAAAMIVLIVALRTNEDTLWGDMIEDED